MKRLRGLAWISTYESVIVSVAVLLMFVGFAAADDLASASSSSGGEKFNRRNQSMKSELEQLAKSLLQIKTAETEQLLSKHPELTSSTHINKR